MICPAVLDPFQGANYRLVACMHQALLCPIIAKLFGYVFTPASLKIPSSQKLTEHVSAKSVLSQRKFKDILDHPVENTNRSTFDDTNNGSMSQHTKANTLIYNESQAQSINGKQIENGCDNLFGDASIPCPSNSNKKTH